MTDLKITSRNETAVKPYKVIKRGVELLPNLIQAEIVPGVGHSMIHREPDWVITRVVHFIDQHEKRKNLD